MDECGRIKYRGENLADQDVYSLGTKLVIMVYLWCRHGRHDLTA
jgi:hypothetical protein